MTSHAEAAGVVGRPFEIQQSQMIAMRPYMVWELMHKRLHRAESSRESVPWRNVSCHPWASTTWCLRRLKIYFGKLARRGLAGRSRLCKVRPGEGAGGFAGCEE